MLISPRSSPFSLPSTPPPRKPWSWMLVILSFLYSFITYESLNNIGWLDSSDLLLFNATWFLRLTHCWCTKLYAALRVPQNPTAHIHFIYSFYCRGTAGSLFPSFLVIPNNAVVTIPGHVSWVYTPDMSFSKSRNPEL